METGTTILPKSAMQKQRSNVCKKSLNQSNDRYSWLTTGLQLLKEKRNKNIVVE